MKMSSKIKKAQKSADPDSTKAARDTSPVGEDTTHELLSGSWISDLTLQKYFEILNNRFLLIHLSLILNPLICHAVKCVEDFRHFLDPLEIEGKLILFLPVNDAKEDESRNGSHWSLLIYCKPAKTFYYYDSMNLKSLPSAVVIANKLNCYLNGNDEVTLTIIDGPQQLNGFDCGIFVCYIIEAVAYTSMTAGTLDFDFVARLQFTKNELIKKRSLMTYIFVNSVTLDDDDLFSLIFEDISMKLQTFTVLKMIHLVGPKPSTSRASLVEHVDKTSIQIKEQETVCK